MFFLKVVCFEEFTCHMINVSYETESMSHLFSLLYKTITNTVLHEFLVDICLCNIACVETL